MKTSTPRTDNASLNLPVAKFPSGKIINYEVVNAKLARTLERELTQAKENLAEIRLLKTHVAMLREALKSIMNDIPLVECNNFHHSKKDRHSGFDCGPMRRWQSAIALADAALASTIPKKIDKKPKIGNNK